MEFPSFKYCPEAILDIPSMTWGNRFESEDDWQFAARRLIGKIAEFPDKVFEMTRPISGQYLHDHWGDLCNDLDLVIVSLAFIGKDHMGRIFPENAAPSGDGKPDWNNLDFDLIRDAESLYQHCRDQFTGYFDGTKDKHSILDDLGEKIEHFAGAEGRGDIGHLYYLLYLEMKFTLDALFPHAPTWSVLEYGYGHFPEHWFKLRSVDFGVLPYQKTTSYFSSTASAEERDVLAFLEYRKNAQRIARQLYFGKSPEAEHTGKGHPESIQPEVHVHENLFFQEGEYWTISDGEEKCQIKSLHGLIYMYHLLSRPGDPVHVSSLVKLVDRPDTSVVDKVDKDSASASRIAKSKKISATGKKVDVEETVELEAIQAAKVALRNVEEKMDRAHDAGDTSRKKLLNKEYDKLIEYIQNHTDHRGRPRKVQTAEKKAQERVQKAITRAVVRIHKYLPDLADHLDTAIDTGFECVYRPVGESNIRWLL